MKLKAIAGTLVRIQSRRAVLYIQRVLNSYCLCSYSTCPIPSCHKQTFYFSSSFFLARPLTQHHPTCPHIASMHIGLRKYALTYMAYVHCKVAHMSRLSTLIFTFYKTQTPPSISKLTIKHYSTLPLLNLQPGQCCWRV